MRMQQMHPLLAKPSFKSKYFQESYNAGLSLINFIYEIHNNCRFDVDGFYFPG
jgi:hypothetical protein